MAPLGAAEHELLAKATWNQDDFETTEPLEEDRWIQRVTRLRPFDHGKGWLFTTANLKPRLPGGVPIVAILDLHAEAVVRLVPVVGGRKRDPMKSAVESLVDRRKRYLVVVRPEREIKVFREATGRAEQVNTTSRSATS